MPVELLNRKCDDLSVDVREEFGGRVEGEPE